MHLRWVDSVPSFSSRFCYSIFIKKKNLSILLFVACFILFINNKLIRDQSYYLPPNKSASNKTKPKKLILVKPIDINQDLLWTMVIHRSQEISQRESKFSWKLYLTRYGQLVWVTVMLNSYSENLKAKNFFLHALWYRVLKCKFLYSLR